MAAAVELLVQHGTDLQRRRHGVRVWASAVMLHHLDAADPLPGANERFWAVARCDHGLLNVQNGRRWPTGVALQLEPRPHGLQAAVGTSPTFVVFFVLKIVILLVPPVSNTYLGAGYGRRSKRRMHVHKLSTCADSS